MAVEELDAGAVISVSPTIYEHGAFLSEPEHNRPLRRQPPGLNGVVGRKAELTAPPWAAPTALGSDVEERDREVDRLSSFRDVRVRPPVRRGGGICALVEAATELARGQRPTSRY